MKLIHNIFSFRKKVAKEVMTPLEELHMLPAGASVAQAAELLRDFPVPTIPLYFRSRRNVVAIAIPRDLIKRSSSDSVREASRPPWFITQSTPIEQILQQFRYNNQKVAIILDPDGAAIGLITLDDILDELFGGAVARPAALRARRPQKLRALIERTLPASTSLSEFNALFEAELPGEPGETLGQLIARELGHSPMRGESVHIENFELTVLDTTLLGTRTIAARSLR